MVFSLCHDTGLRLKLTRKNGFKVIRTFIAPMLLVMSGSHRDISNCAFTNSKKPDFGTLWRTRGNDDFI